MHDAATSPAAVQAAPSRDHLPTLFRATIRHPATWLFVALYLIATMYVAITGHIVDLVSTLEPLFFLLLIALVIVPLTAGAPPPAWETTPAPSRLRLWVPVVVPVLYAGLIVFVVLLATSARVSGIALTVGEYIVPLGAALLMGARWRELGFTKGYRTWWTTLILAIPLLIALAILVVMGILASPLLVPLAFVNFLLAAGIPEELFLRGVLMTRLTGLFGSAWGVVLSSLIFGALHASANIGYFNHTPLPVALALGIIFEGLYGIVLALIFLRTRSLIAAILVHALVDTLNFPLLPHIIHFFH
jgi:membrane protease YdiL (CAAX protease family)